MPGDAERREFDLLLVTFANRSNRVLPLRPGDVVQLDPSRHEPARFGACLMVVTEVKPWGVQGYVKAPGSADLAYYRAETGTFARVGRVEWATGDVFTVEEKTDG
jgi:hypothetical protein